MTLTQAQRVVIVDASVAIPFVEADAAWVAKWRTWVVDQVMLLAPPHFPIEVANALLRGTPTRPVAEVTSLMGSLFSVGVEVADRGRRGIEGALRLADRHRLTVYDAAYLDLAIDVDGQLATLDKALRRAAEAEGVALAA